MEQIEQATAAPGEKRWLSTETRLAMSTGSAGIDLSVFGDDAPVRIMSSGSVDDVTRTTTYGARTTPPTYRHADTTDQAAVVAPEYEGPVVEQARRWFGRGKR